MGEELTGPVPVTLDDMAEFLHPRVSADQLRRIIAQLPRLQPVGTSPTGGRPVQLWDAGAVMELHTAIRRWL